MRVTANDPISKKVNVIVDGQVLGFVTEACTEDGYIRVYLHPNADFSGLEVNAVDDTRHAYIWDTEFAIVDKDTKEIYASYTPTFDKEDPEC